MEQKKITMNEKQLKSIIKEAVAQQLQGLSPMANAANENEWALICRYIDELNELLPVAQARSEHKAANPDERFVEKGARDAVKARIHTFASCLLNLTER